MSLKKLLRFLSRSLVDVTIYRFISSTYSCSHLFCLLFAGQSLPVSVSCNEGDLYSVSHHIVKEEYQAIITAKTFDSH